MLLFRLSATKFASFLRHIILPTVACMAVPYFSTSPHKRRDLKGKIIVHEMCIVTFSTTVWNIPRRTQWDTIINVQTFHVKHRIVLSDSKETWNFSKIWKNGQISNFINEAVTRRNYVNAPTTHITHSQTPKNTLTATKFNFKNILSHSKKLPLISELKMKDL